MGKHFGDNDSSRISVHELFSRSVEDKKNKLKNDSSITADDTDNTKSDAGTKGVPESMEHTEQPCTSYNDTPSSGDIVIEYTDGSYHTDNSFADKFSQNSTVDTHADNGRTVSPHVDTDGNDNIVDTTHNIGIIRQDDKIEPDNSTDNVKEDATEKSKDNNIFDYKSPTHSASSNVTIEFYNDNALREGNHEVPENAHTVDPVDTVDTVDNADTKTTEKKGEEKRAVKHAETTPRRANVPTPFPDKEETNSEEKPSKTKAQPTQPQRVVVKKIEESAIEDSNTSPHDTSSPKTPCIDNSVDNTPHKMHKTEEAHTPPHKDSVAQELPVTKESDSVEEQLDKVSEPKPTFLATPHGDNTHTVGTGDTVENTEKEHGDSKGSGDEGRDESSTPPSTFNTSPNAVPTPIPDVPNFKKRVLAKKKDTSAETEFENVKPDETKMTKDSRIIDQANRNKKIKYAVIFLVSIIAVALVGWLLYDNFSNSVNHSENVQQEQQEQDNTDYDSEHNFMYQMAEDKDPKFLDKIDHHPKENKVENNAISNDINGTKITFGSRYILTNDNVCVVSTETDFCYLTELAENKDGEPGDNVATAYSFANIFTTQFFKDYSHIEEVNIPGADYAAHGTVTIASKEKNALFIAHDNGLGYMFVFDDSSQMNEFVSTMGISPN